MRTDDFDYPLPDELIAQAPAEPRDSCRLLVLHREDGSVEHRRFSDIIEYLEPGDEPEAFFRTDAKIVRAQELCNVHGLWVD